MSSATRNFGSGALLSLTVADAAGTPGVDFTLTAVARSTGVSHALTVGSGSAAYDGFVDGSPSGVAFLLVSRSPSDQAVALDEVIVLVTEQDATFELGEKPDTVVVRLLRDGGDFVWQTAPVERPAYGVSGILAASSVERTGITTAYTGGLTAPTASQRFCAVRFERGSTPPGSTIWVDVWTFGSATGVQVGVWGLNVSLGLPAVNIVNTIGTSGVASPQVQVGVFIETPTQRVGFIDSTNSGNNGTGGARSTSTNLNTDEDWDLFLVSANGGGTYVANGLRVEGIPTGTGEGVSVFF